MKWKEMTGQERYRVVEMASRGEKPLKEICETFGVSRQALSKAMEKVSQAAMDALEPKKAGRKPKTPEEQKLKELTRQTTSLSKEVEHWKTRFEVAQAFIEITREQERREQKKKKQQGAAKRTAREADGPGNHPRLAPVDDGADVGDTEAEPGKMEKEG